ncbi:hypothetical protein ACFQZK_02195 [Rhodococcus aetherivorans]
MKNLVAVVAAVVSVLLFGAGPAQAHSALIGSTPAAEAALAAPRTGSSCSSISRSTPRSPR